MDPNARINSLDTFWALADALKATRYTSGEWPPATGPLTPFAHRADTRAPYLVVGPLYLHAHPTHTVLEVKSWTAGIYAPRVVEGDGESNAPLDRAWDTVKLGSVVLSDPTWGMVLRELERARDMARAALALVAFADSSASTPPEWGAPAAWTEPRIQRDYQPWEGLLVCGWATIDVVPDPSDVRRRIVRMSPNLRIEVAGEVVQTGGCSLDRAGWALMAAALVAYNTRTSAQLRAHYEREVEGLSLALARLGVA